MQNNETDMGKDVTNNESGINEEEKHFEHGQAEKDHISATASARGERLKAIRSKHPIKRIFLPGILLLSALFSACIIAADAASSISIDEISVIAAAAVFGERPAYAPEPPVIDIGDTTIPKIRQQLRKLYSAGIAYKAGENGEDGKKNDENGGGTDITPSLSDAELISLLYSREPAELEAGEHLITAKDLSVSVKYGLSCSNETGYKIDLPSYLATEYVQQPYSELIRPYESEEFAPVVLIVHTHGTESYAETDSGKYSENNNSRTTDKDKNVVAVGKVLAETLRDAGISVLHCTEMFDEESYSTAYNRSGAAIREYTAIYPSISYVFDVHRDSVIGAEMEKLRPVTVYNGETIAQFMCVVGTDYKGAPHENWHDNLTLACQLQAKLWQRLPNLTRRLSIRSASFYQQYTSGSLLLEIGSCGNTLDEAKRCAVMVGAAVSELILSGGEAVAQDG